jgi:inorganic pyrophosphatase
MSLLQYGAESCGAGAATNTCVGLALGYVSCIVPVFVIAAAIYTGVMSELPGMENHQVC